MPVQGHLSIRSVTIMNHVRSARVSSKIEQVRYDLITLTDKGTWYNEAIVRVAFQNHMSSLD